MPDHDTPHNDATGDVRKYMFNHTSSQQHVTRNDEHRGCLTLMFNFDFKHYQMFVRNGFS